MRAVVQRVTHAEVTSEGTLTGKIGAGLCVLVGVAREDSEEDPVSLASKVVGVRIFEDADGKMNLSVLETGGAILAVSQFTLLGDTRKGRRPSFGDAMEPVRANALFERFVAECRALGVRVETGRFRTHMRVLLENDGPVTLLLDTQKVF
jgi:D-tyrosyl-tRNA(Tyr) deacylase